MDIEDLIKNGFRYATDEAGKDNKAELIHFLPDSLIRISIKTSKVESMSLADLIKTIDEKVVEEIEERTWEVCMGEDV